MHIHQIMYLCYFFFKVLFSLYIKKFRQTHYYIYVCCSVNRMTNKFFCYTIETFFYSVHKLYQTYRHNNILKKYERKKNSFNGLKHFTKINPLNNNAFPPHSNVNSSSSSSITTIYKNEEKETYKLNLGSHHLMFLHHLRSFWLVYGKNKRRKNYYQNRKLFFHGL